jgi:hypothetical protein
VEDHGRRRRRAADEASGQHGRSDLKTHQNVTRTDFHVHNAFFRSLLGRLFDPARRH